MQNALLFAQGAVMSCCAALPRSLSTHVVTLPTPPPAVSTISTRQVLDRLFNGFGGRLFNQIRSREGLAYSVSGGWTATPIDHPGLFLATAETAQPAALLAALRGALDDAVAAPPTADELRRAKQVRAEVTEAAAMLILLQGRLVALRGLH